MKKSNYTNNFYGDAKGIQIQQGNSNSTQIQKKISDTEIDYEKIKQTIYEIKKYENLFDDIYKENSTQVRMIVEEVLELTEQKKEPVRIKRALDTLKDLTVGITGSLIATGIVGILSAL